MDVGVKKERHRSCCCDDNCDFEGYWPKQAEIGRSVIKLPVKMLNYASQALINPSWEVRAFAEVRLFWPRNQAAMVHGGVHGAPKALTLPTGGAACQRLGMHH